MTDLAVRLFLHDGARDGKKELYVVNPDRDIVGRYKDLLGNAFEIKDEFVGDNVIKNLVEEICRNDTSD